MAVLEPGQKQEASVLKSLHICCGDELAWASLFMLVAVILGISAGACHLEFLRLHFVASQREAQRDG